MKFILTTTFFAISLIMNCGTSEVRFEKRAKFNPNTTKVITMAVFDTSTSTTAAADDESLKAFGALAQKEVGSIYGNLIPGGDLTIKAAEAIGIKKELDTALGKLTEVIVNGNSLDPKTTEIFAKLAQYLNVEALAFPIASGGKTKLSDGGVVYRFVVYDVRDPGIQYVGETSVVEVSSLALSAAPDDQQKNTILAAATTKAVNGLFAKIKAELAPASK
jgi:hypothetical protein